MPRERSQKAPWRGAALLAAGLLLTSSPRTMAQERAGATATAAGPELRLNQSEGRLLRLPRPPASVLIADPSVADIAAPSDRTVFIIGKKPGRTSLFTLDANGAQIASWRVVVGVGDKALRELIRTRVGDYPVSLQATPNGAVLSGAVPTPLVAERVRAVAAEFTGGPIVNNLRVTGFLQVRVAEVSRSVSKELGINWEAAGTAGANVAVGLFTDRTFLNAAGLAVGAGAVGGAVGRSATNAGSLFAGYNRGATRVNALLDVLASESLVRELAEPTLVTTSGQEAKFLAGGQFLVPVGQGLGQVGIDYKNFGVSLSFTPTVVNEGLISIKVAPEVSTLLTDVSGRAITENGFTVPALSVRRAETTVELGSG